MSQFDSDALDIVRRLQNRQFMTAFVGGCVRDLLMGRKPKDFDIVTDARPRDIKSVIPNSYIIGRRFRLVLARRGQKQFDIATFRKEPLVYTHYREVNENLYGTPEDDAFRRDFTLNALFYDPFQGKILDFVDGEKDIREKIVRVIGNPLVRFQEDPIRILRAIRFCARLGFTLAKETEEAIRASAHYLGLAVPDRLREELVRMLREGNSSAAVEMMQKLHVLQMFLPEWNALKNYWLPPSKAAKPQDKKSEGNLTGLLKYLIASKSSNQGVRMDRLLTHLLQQLDAHQRKVGEVSTPFALTIFFLPVIRLSHFAAKNIWEFESKNSVEDSRTFTTLHQSLRLSNQEVHEMSHLLLMRQRLWHSPRDKETSFKQSIIKHPTFPFVLLLSKWEASVLQAKSYLEAISEWDQLYQEILATGFKAERWEVPGPYDRKNERDLQLAGITTSDSPEGDSKRPPRRRRRRRRRRGGHHGRPQGPPQSS